MYAIALMMFCTVGPDSTEPMCATGQRDDSLAANWHIATTAKECEQANIVSIRKMVEDAGLTLVYAKVKCAPVGT